MFFKPFAFIVESSLLFLFWAVAAGFAGEGRWEEPWSGSSSPRVGEEGSPEFKGGPCQKVAERAIGFYKKYISPVDGDRCPCYPTCAQYSLEAIRKHGALVGGVMTFDRLIHESDEIRNAPLVKVYDSYRYLDSVENNDFWWDRNRNRQKAAVSVQQSAISKIFGGF